MMKILKPGLFTTVQDLGRASFAGWGVPESGCMDRNSARIANQLLGNHPEAAVLECTMMGPEVTFERTGFITVTGATFELYLNGEHIETHTVYKVVPGDHLVFGKLIQGLRAYLAITGGFQTQSVLGSRSYYFPLTETDRLMANQIIPYDEQSNRNATVDINGIHTPLDSQLLFVGRGPEYEWLSEAQQRMVSTTVFTVSNRNNRMAYQLEPSLGTLQGNLLTSPVVPGTVQMTPGGFLFVLMRDGQTTGGYPRVLQLTEDSLDALAQLRTGSSFRLKIMA